MITLFLIFLILICAAIAGGFLLVVFHIVVWALIGAAIAACIACGILALICKITGKSIKEYRIKRIKEVKIKRPEMLECNPDEEAYSESEDDKTDIESSSNPDNNEIEKDETKEEVIRTDIRNYYDSDLSEAEIIERISKKNNVDASYVKSLM